VLCFGVVFAVVDAAQLDASANAGHQQRQGLSRAWKESASTFTATRSRGHSPMNTRWGLGD